MNDAFNHAYQNLNHNQKLAVDTIDGPVLVIAGPGTGKTQLLSARVANILRQTDAAPENILCLTYTDSAAFNMRERLNTFIGKDSYKVAIGTFHSFGQNIIHKHRDYFAGRFETPVDELTTHQILEQILFRADSGNLLKYEKIARLKTAITDCKRNDLSPAKLRAIANQNIASETKVNAKLNDLLSQVRGKRKLADLLPIYAAILKIIKSHIPKSAAITPSLQIYADELESTLSRAADSKPLTAWKNQNTDKNFQDQFVLKNHVANKKLLHLADLYEEYQAELSKNCFFDFDDMILETIRALETHDDLRFSLQEQYQYILLDEYQDTNRAQSRIIELLTDNPVNEGKPNVMAVGDDDQAIMSFQGAESSNLQDFATRYNGTKIINLSDNYRSAQDILDFAKNISRQIAQKPQFLAQVEKPLFAQKTFKNAAIERLEFPTDLAECQWIAETISRLPKGEWSRVAILAPRHKLLAKILPFLRAQNIPVNYERRENILHEKTILQIIDLLELVSQLTRNEPSVAHLWAKVMSQEFWQIDTLDIWHLSWQARADQKTWHELALASPNPKIQSAVNFILQLAVKAENATFDEILSDIVNGDAASALPSPFKTYYLKQNPAAIYTTISALTILREHFAAAPNMATVADFLNFVKAHLAADLKILDTSPLKENDQAVNVMTVHKVKGLEFEHVFLPFASNENWNKSAGNDNSITLPNNLRFARKSSIEGDEKLRLFFVAATRAQSHLYITNSAGSFSGKKSARLAYLNEIETGGEIVSQILPAKYQKVRVVPAAETPVLASDIEKLWSETWLLRHLPQNVKMQDLLSEKIQNLRYSASNLTTFFDTKYGGPLKFYENTILGFPSFKSPSTIFGDLIHKIFDQYTREVQANKTPNLEDLLSWFFKHLDTLKLDAITREDLAQKAQKHLPKYYAKRQKMLNNPSVKTEIALGFGNQTVAASNILIRGRLDRIEINEAAKTLTIVDFKTGKPKTAKDTADITLRKYSHQLYFYKILLQNSAEYHKYKIEEARLEFIESTPDGEVIDPLKIPLTPETETYVQNLLQTLHRHVQNLNFPAIDPQKFPPTATGMKKFENELIVLTL